MIDMEYIKAFEKEDTLIAQYGKEKFFTVWAMGLYLDTSDLQQLALDNLTDCAGDKKIDFLRYDSDDQILYVVQGYYANKVKDAAKANKASDLNAAIAWLFNGDLQGFTEQMRDMVAEIRNAISLDKLGQIVLLYVHNCGESKDVDRELQTACNNLKDILKDHTIDVTYNELGNQSLERLYLKQVSNIVVKDEIECPFAANYEETSSSEWKSCIVTVNGTWLRTLYNTYQARLFSANYRGFLGINRNRINKGIKNSAESAPSMFWAFNNGITILTTKYEAKSTKTILHGISIINGAQTTGSLGQLPATINLDSVKIMARIVECSNSELITDIVKYNNTQNKITAWDSYGNDESQKELQSQFKTLNHQYTYKRGFESHNTSLNIENCIQPLLSFLGKYKDANRSKATVFETRSLYSEAYEKVKARHVLFVHCLFTCISEIKNENKEIINKGINVGCTDKLTYNAFAPLRAKHFIMSIVAAVIPKLSSSLPVLKDISFVPNVSNASTKTIPELVGDIKPFVKLVISQIVSFDSKNGIYSHYAEVDAVNQISTHAENQIAALSASAESIKNSKEAFLAMLCNG